MNRLVRWFAGMPLPLLIGLNALALMQILAMIAWVVWPKQFETIILLSMIGTLLVLASWVVVIIYEVQTGKKVGR
jgi:uncharacterized membrane protein YqjE